MFPKWAYLPRTTTQVTPHLQFFVQKSHSRDVAINGSVQVGQADGIDIRGVKRAVVHTPEIRAEGPARQVVLELGRSPPDPAGCCKGYVRVGPVSERGPRLLQVGSTSVSLRWREDGVGAGCNIPPDQCKAA